MNLVTTLSKVRATELSPQAILLLSIVNDYTTNEYPRLFIGEVEAVYRSTVTKGKDLYPEEVRAWSYNGVGSLLRKLSTKGYLNRIRIGRYVEYGMTTKGINILNRVTETPNTQNVNLKVVG